MEAVKDVMTLGGYIKGIEINIYKTIERTSFNLYKNATIQVRLYEITSHGFSYGCNIRFSYVGPSRYIKKP